MTARYNLIIYHVPEKQSVSDFHTIRNKMAVRAPEIEVHIVSTSVATTTAFWRKAAERPTLIFSAIAIRLGRGDVPIRGARLISNPLSKFEEAQLMSRAGAPVPETILIEPETRIDEAQWGPFTVIKPNSGKQGRGVRLIRTKDVRWTDTSALPKDDPRHGQELLAQRYVDTGPFVASFRVMMVLGRPVYSVVSTAIERRPDPMTSNAVEMDVAANGVERSVTLNNDAEIIDMAKAIHAKLPQLPVMGIDIIREQNTGRLFALEYNSGGRFWHISSDYGRAQQRKYGLDYNSQFDALNTITDALIEATRKRAV